MGWRLSDGTAALFIYLNMIKYIARLETTPEEGTTRFLTLTAGVFPMSLNVTFASAGGPPALGVVAHSTLSTIKYGRSCT
jgi:hypothetical protein